MADHGQPDIAGAAATAQADATQADATQAEAERPGLAEGLYQGAIARVEAPLVHHGRPVSWAAVSIIMIGFIVGGVALIFGPTWWLFWAGCGVAGFGGIVALASGIFNDWY